MTKIPLLANEEGEKAQHVDIYFFKRLRLKVVFYNSAERTHVFAPLVAARREKISDFFNYRLGDRCDDHGDASNYRNWQALAF